MFARSYKLIIVLLCVSMLSVLLLQGFWINSFYVQKQEEFRRSVYAALANITARLNEMDRLDIIKQSVSPVTNRHSKLIADTRARLKATRKNKKVTTTATTTASGSGIRIVMSAPAFVNMETRHITSGKRKTDSASGRSEIIISDSVININNRGKLYVSRHTEVETTDQEEIDKLLNKMLTEIQTIDVSPIEDIKPDTLRQLIRKELEALGMFTPFEFLLKKQDTATERIIARSEDYKDGAESYKSDLSGKKIFRDDNYLYLQLPREADYVFARMKKLIGLSALFSLLLIVVFYITLRSIMRQKKLGDMKNDFINNMTHELKTPIATISLAIDAITNPQVKEDQEKFDQYTAILKEENQKLNAHVEHVLQMARLDKGELQLQCSVVDLNRLVKASVSTHQLQISSVEASVEMSLFRPSLYIRADEFHITTVINNLLDNALKYSQKPCNIHISTSYADHTAVLSIADNGIGIDENQHKKIFEKFYRVQAGNLHDTKGFGLGLSYVKSVVETHGGTITLKSAKGKGSEFTLKLPAYES